MRKWLPAAILSLTCAGASGAQVLTCEEIEQMGEDLTALGIAMDDENVPIGEDSSEDQDLRDVVDGLAVIAEAEDDEDLADAAAGMDEAWHAMDRDAFTDALADAVAKLAVVSVSECE